jgi:hypothetical protein
MPPLDTTRYRLEPPPQVRSMRLSSHASVTRAASFVLGLTPHATP